MSLVAGIANVHTCHTSTHMFTVSSLKLLWMEHTHEHTHRHGLTCTHTAYTTHVHVSTFERLYCCGFGTKLTDSTNGTLNETSWICQITIKKKPNTYTQLTYALTHQEEKCVLCSPLWVYESELLAYILVIIISSFLYTFFCCSQCAFSCNSNERSSFSL